MKNIFRILIIVIFGIIFYSCENENIVETTLPFEEKIIIRGVVSPMTGKLAINFSKSLPLNQEYKIEDAELKDVTAYLKDTAKIYPLKYSGKGDYKTLIDVYINQGDAFELFANWRGNKYYAKTKIPKPPENRGITQVNEGKSFYLKMNINTLPGQVYGASWIVISGGSVIEEATDLYNLTQPSDAGKTNTPIRTGLFPEKYNSSVYSDKVGMRIYVFDEQFYNYYITKNYNQPIKDIFTQNGGLVNWNIEGNALGLFIGVIDAIYLKK